MSVNESCYKCEQPLDNDTTMWIQCHKCGRWLHRACVTTIDLFEMAEDEIADMEFECDYC